MFEALGGRKFVAATLTVAIGVIIMAWKGDVPPGILQLLEVTLGVFASGNVVATVAGAFYPSTKGSQEDAGPVVPASDASGVANSEVGGRTEPAGNSAPETSQAGAPSRPSPTLTEIYAGLAEIYQKIEKLEGTSAEVAKGMAVSQKVLNVLLERK